MFSVLVYSQYLQLPHHKLLAYIDVNIQDVICVHFLRISLLFRVLCQYSRGLTDAAILEHVARHVMVYPSYRIVLHASTRSVQQLSSDLRVLLRLQCSRHELQV